MVNPIIGTTANDTIGMDPPYSSRTSAQDETIYGGDGNDTIYGFDGNDVLYGDDGELTLPHNSIVGDNNDALFGGDGNDTIVGGAGDDTISGGGGDDSIDGGDGNNQITGDHGADMITSGSGDDVIAGDENVVSAHGGYWSPPCYSGACDASVYYYGAFIGGENDTIAGRDGNDIISGDQFTATAYGEYGGGTIVGGKDSLAGGGGNDTIYGDGVDASTPNSYGTGSVSGGDDVITGGAGADLLYGDWGSVTTDSIIGGHDRFIYQNIGDGGDTIADFRHAEDVIDVSAMDANIALAGDQAFGFAGTVPTNNSIWFSDNGTDTTLYFDNNGNAAPDMSIVLLGVHGSDLSLADFVA